DHLKLHILSGFAESLDSCDIGGKSISFLYKRGPLIERVVDGVHTLLAGAELIRRMSVVVVGDDVDGNTAPILLLERESCLFSSGCTLISGGRRRARIFVTGTCAEQHRNK